MSTARKRMLSPRETDVLGAARAPCRTRDERGVETEGNTSATDKATSGISGGVVASHPARKFRGHISFAERGSACASQYNRRREPGIPVTGCEKCAGPTFAAVQARATEGLYAQFRDLQSELPFEIQPTRLESTIHSTVVDDADDTSRCRMRYFTAELHVEYFIITTNRRSAKSADNFLPAYEMKGKHSMQMPGTWSCCTNYYLLRVKPYFEPYLTHDVDGNHVDECPACQGALPLLESQKVVRKKLMIMYQHFQHQLPLAIQPTSFIVRFVDESAETPERKEGCGLKNFKAVLDVEYEVMPYVVHPDVLPLEVTQLIWSYLDQVQPAWPWLE